MSGVAHVPVGSLPWFRNAVQSDGGFHPVARCSSSPVRITAEKRRGAPRNSAYHIPATLLAWTAVATPQKRRNGRGTVCCMAPLVLEITPASLIVLSSALSFTALRIFIYFRMEYIIAGMLGSHVPRGGAKVVELNIRGGRNLYYYPADIAQVVAVSIKPNKQLLENQAVRAGVPIQIITQGAGTLGLPSSSVDAVVSVCCLRDVPDREVAGVLREAVRILKPGKPLIFVESVGAKNAFTRNIQNVVTGLLNLVGSKRFVIDNLLSYIQEVADFEDAEYEEVFSLVDPHLVGIAKKKVTTRDPTTEPRKGFKKAKA